MPEKMYAVKNLAILRMMLGASQAGFAKLIGVSTNTVQAWEQDVNPVPGIAAKLFQNIRDNMPYWRRQLAKNSKSKKRPKGGKSFHADLMCSPVTVSYDFAKRRGVLVMEESHCCDMEGCVFLFESIDPHVKLIETVSGKKPDTQYVRRDKWEALMPAQVH